MTDLRISELDAVADLQDTDVLELARSGASKKITGANLKSQVVAEAANATQTELDAHVNDASAAHAASAVSTSSATLSGTGTDVQAVLEELDNLLDDHSDRHENGGADEMSLAGLDGTPSALQTHLDDASDAHDASAISVVSTTLVGTGTDVQAVLEELDDAIAALGGGGGGTQRKSILGWGTRTDDTGEVAFAPADISFGSNDVARQMVLELGSALAAAPTVKHGVYGQFEVPEDYESGANLVVRWAATLTSGDVVFDFDYRAIADDESLDQATWQQSVTSTKTADGTARERDTVTIDLTDGNFSPGDTVLFFFGRDGADSADTMAGRAYVFDVMLEYTT